MKRISILLLFILLLQYFSIAQVSTDTLKISLESFTTKDGLSQGFVRSIIQDKEGYMWFATKDGLNKYDGYQVTVYRNNPKDPYSLPDNFVMQLVEDDMGRFWVGTSTKGLCLFDKKTEKFYPVKTNFFSSHLINDGIKTLEYRKGKLFVWQNSGVFILDVSKVKPGDFSEENFKKIKRLFDFNAIQQSEQYKVSDLNVPSVGWFKDDAIYVSVRDSIFICTPQNNFNKWNLSGFHVSRFGKKDNNSENIVFINTKELNKVIVIGKEKLVVYDRSKDAILHKLTFPKRDIYYGSFITDADGNLFFANSFGNYWIDLKTYKIKNVVTNNVPVYNWLTGCYDRTGVLWMSTNIGYGIVKYDNRKQLFRNFPLHSINNFEITTKKLGVLTGIGPSTFDLQTGFIKKMIPAGIENYYEARSMVRDNEGTIFYTTFPSSDGPRVLISFNPKNNILNVNPFGCDKIFKDKQNNLWGLETGNNNTKYLIRINKTTAKTEARYQFPIKNDFNEYPFISDYWQDKNNVFWFGTLQGLFSFDEKKNAWHQWKNIPADTTSLSANMIFSLCPDANEPEKYLWMGTNGSGLNRFEYSTGKCIRYTEKDGLPNGVIYGLLNDNSGNLWASTNKGLSCLISPLLGIGAGGEVFRNFTEEDGLQGNEFNRYEYFKLSTGELLFGGVNGLSIFNPADVLKQSPAPNIVLTGLSVYNKPVDFKTDSNVISSPISYANTITLPHDRNMFTLEFAALESSTAGKKHYKYKLDGFDNSWIDNGIKHEATYTNLSPGTYTFNVIGAGRDEVWNEKGTSIKIIILPAWYQTWWFRLLLALTIAAAAYSLYRYRLQKALQLQTVRNRIASDLHDEIGSTLSSISLYSEAAKKMLNGNESANKVLSKINSNTSEMMEAMSDIVWAVNTRNDQLDNLVNRMRSFAVQISELKNFELHFEENKNIPDMPLDMVQRKNMYLIFKEAVNNAAKYADCKNVWIAFSKKNNLLEMIIRDDGKGFTLLSPWRGAGGEGDKRGGNGLFNMKKRADDLKATIKIDSEEGNGTKISLVIKL